MNVLTISQALGNREGEGSVLSLTASHVEELNLDLLELQERLLAEDSRRDFHGESQEEEEGEKQAESSGRRKPTIPWKRHASSGERDFPYRPGASLSGT